MFLAASQLAASRTVCARSGGGEGARAVRPLWSAVSCRLLDSPPTDGRRRPPLAAARAVGAATTVLYRPVSGSSGRVVTQQQRAGKYSAGNGGKLCSGCGTEVVGGATGGTSMAAGADANADRSVSKKKAKKLRYFDLDDAARGRGFLCERCKALQSDNVWKAYDALHDVPPEVFSDQLKFIVGRRRFGICLVVVDATDPEHTTIKNLRKMIGKAPCVLVLNKTDLVPRLGRNDARILRGRSTASSKVQYDRVFAVSAETSAGIVDLAQHLLENLGGKDVFVIGAANVGKSTLVKRLSAIIAVESRRGKGGKWGGAAKRRIDAVTKMNVTRSHLPGTTLQAVRVPCFSSFKHAMWDTPGIINRRALQYSLFPPHLMEPLARPESIAVPDRKNGLTVDLRSGMSLLIEAKWMDDGSDDDEDKNGEQRARQDPCVLGRIDMTDIREGHSVMAQAFVHPFLRVRVVPTARAPTAATIPPTYVDCVRHRIQRASKQGEKLAKKEFSLPLLAFERKEAPRGELVPGEKEWSDRDGRYCMDVVFASLGWISFAHHSQFELIPHCVEGSVYSKRPALYPRNLARYLENHGAPEHEPDKIDDETFKRLRDATREGRHYSNRRKESKESDEYGGYIESEFY